MGKSIITLTSSMKMFYSIGPFKQQLKKVGMEKINNLILKKTLYHLPSLTIWK